MENPRPEKVAVVDEVKQRLAAADATLLTEYRGLNVAAMAELRRSLRAAGGEYVVYKNTLVRFAARDLGLEIDELLVGPTAVAFVSPGPDGTGDPVTVAKALKEFAKTHPALVVKGGVLGDRLLSAEEAAALAEVAPREELLARLAGGLAAPMRQFAGLLQALPRNFAYGLQALIDDRGGVVTAEAPPAEAPDSDTDTATAAAPTAEAPTAEAADTDAPPAEVADGETDTTDTTEAPAAEASTDTTEATAAAETPTEES